MLESGYLPRLSASGFSSASGIGQSPDRIPTDGGDKRMTTPPPSLTTGGQMIRQMSRKFLRRHQETFLLSWHTISLSQSSVSHPLLRNVTGKIKSGTVCAVVSSEQKALVALLETIASNFSSGNTYRQHVKLDVRINDQTVNTESYSYRKKVTFLRQGDAILAPKSTVKESLIFHAKMNRLSSRASRRMVGKIISNLRLESCENTLIEELTIPEKARSRVAIALVARPAALLLDNPLVGLDVYEAFQTISVLRQVAVDLNTAVLVSIEQPSSELLFALDDVSFISRGSVIFTGHPDDIVPYFYQLGYSCPPSYSPSDYLLFLFEVIPSEEHDRLVSSWLWQKGNELDLQLNSESQNFFSNHTFENPQICAGVDTTEEIVIAGGAIADEYVGLDLDLHRENEDDNDVFTPSSHPNSPIIVSQAIKEIDSFAIDDDNPPVNRLISEDSLEIGLRLSPRIALGDDRPDLRPPSEAGGGGASPMSMTSFDELKPPLAAATATRVRYGNRLNQFSQFFLLYLREIKFVLRTIDVVVIRFALFSILCALIALMLYNIGTDAQSVMTAPHEEIEIFLNNYYGAISLMILISLFGKVEGVSVSIPAIRSLFLAEHGMARLYSLLPFLFSQLFIEFPSTAFMAVIQVSISYWIIGFSGNFFIWVVIVFTASVATSSIGWLISSLSYSPLTALQLVPVIVLPQILFSGLLIDIQLIPSWLAWMEYLCYLKYCINIAFINEVEAYKDNEYIKNLASQNFIDMNKTGAYASIICIFIIGSRVLAAIALYYNRKVINWNL